VLNRFFGQKPQEEPKKESAVTQERVGGDSMANPDSNPLKSSLSRTRKLFGRISESFVKSTPITDELWDDLEEALLSADVGPGTTTWLIEHLRKRAVDEHMRNTSQVQAALREELTRLLGKPSDLHFSTTSPLTVILVIGVNGSGKTTSIAKMSYRLTREGHRVILAAAAILVERAITDGFVDYDNAVTDFDVIAAQWVGTNPRLILNRSSLATKIRKRNQITFITTATPGKSILHEIASFLLRG